LKFLFHQNIFLVFLFNKFSFIVSLMSIMYRRMAIQMKKKKGETIQNLKIRWQQTISNIFPLKKKKKKEERMVAEQRIRSQCTFSI